MNRFFKFGINKVKNIDDLGSLKITPEPIAQKETLKEMFDSAVSEQLKIFLKKEIVSQLADYCLSKEELEQLSDFEKIDGSDEWVEMEDDERLKRFSLIYKCSDGYGAIKYISRKKGLLSIERLSDKLASDILALEEQSQ